MFRYIIRRESLAIINFIRNEQERESALQQNSVVRANDWGVRRWVFSDGLRTISRSVQPKFWIVLSTTENHKFSRVSKDLIGLTKSNIAETSKATNHLDVILFPFQFA